MKRFEVTIERKVIVYAEDALGAEIRALAGVRDSASSEATAISELPALLDEKRAPIIDRAPSRETQK